MSEYIHAVLLLHSVKKEVNEENLANLIKAAGAEPDMQRIKMVVSALSNVDIDKVLSGAASSFVTPTTAVPSASTQQKAEEKPKEEKKEEKAEEVAGLGALFE